ncbi:MAG: hypothetical protein R2847_05455 [Bacteroidia bacterium]
MRTLVTVIATLAAASLSSCSSSQQTANAYTDDVYYSAGTPKAETPATVNNTPAAGQSDYASNEKGTATSSDENRFDYQSDGSSASQSGNTYVTNNYYNDDDYYDYAYTARLRRFYRPMWGYGYYDSYYTNSYWYDYNPYNWGVSIYCGYNWWAPSFWYAPTFTYFSWGYNPYNYWWSYPSYGYYPSYYYGWNNYNYGYWNGYNNGYWNGYMDGYYNGYYGYNPYYFNSYDYYSYNNNIYYGPRRGGSGSSHHYTPPRSVADSYNRALSGDVKTTLPVSNAYTSNMNLPSRNNVNSDVVTPANNSGRTNTNSGEVIHPRNTTNTNNSPVKNPRVDEYSTPVKDSRNTETSPVKNPRADEYSAPVKNDRNNSETAPVRDNRSNEYSTPRNDRNNM